MIPASPDRRHFRLPSQRRIRRKAQFDALQASGRRLANSLFGLTLRANDVQRPRLGLAVSIKVAGNGVERNRIRRAIRESFRLNQHELPPVDLVVSARSRARGVAGRELRESLADLWGRVRQVINNP